MSSNPKKHHFVPECYLKRFAFDKNGELYKLRVKPYHWAKKVKQANISSICYEPDFYTIEKQALLDRYKIDDPYYIEKFGFTYEQEFLTKILDALPKREIIGSLQYRKFLIMILDLKRRNNSFRANYSVDNKVGKEIIERNIRQLKEAEHKMKGSRIPPFAEKIEKYLLTEMKSQSFYDEIFHRSFLKYSEDDKSQNVIVDFLLRLKPIIFKTTKDYPFITSDNPGGVLLKNDRVQSTGFNDQFSTFFFPIDPLHLFALHLGFNEQKKSAFRKVNHRDVNSTFVDYVNKAAIANCNKIVISNSKLHLSNLKDKLLTPISKSMNKIKQ
jgi:hypothetical protein